MVAKVSIIVPLYNVSSYVEQCLESIFNQAFDDIEYVLVNDCSTDNTMQIVNTVIDRFPDRKKNVKLFHNEKNSGLGYTRKCGLLNATGKYVLQIDSDDWVEYDFCEKMYSLAEKFDADIVVSDYYENFPHKEKYISQAYTENPQQDFESILLGVLHGSVCNKLIKRSLYIDNNITPPEDFSLYEDKITTLPLFFYAKKIVYANQAFLHYRKHNQSITSNISARQVEDTVKFLKKLEEFFRNNHLLEQWKDEYKSCILYHKKNFLLDEKYYSYWDDYYPEVNQIKYVFGIKSYDWKRKLVTILAMLFSKKILKYFFNLGKRLN